MSYLLLENSELQTTDGASKTAITSFKIDTITGKTTNNSGAVGYSKASNVTQASSITTAVTSNGVAGQITTITATTSANSTSTFTVNNSACLSTSFVQLQLVSYAGTYGTNGVPLLAVSSVSAGSFNITIANASANALNGALVIYYHLI